MQTSTGSIEFHAPRWLLPAAVAAILVIIAVGVFAYRDQYVGLKTQAEDELAAIALLKADELAGWRADKVFDGQRMSQSPSITLFVNRYLAEPTAEHTSELEGLLRSLRFGERYRDVILLDPTGAVLLSASGDDGVSVQPRTVAALDTALAEDRAVITELDPGPPADAYLDVVTPIYRQAGEAGDPVAAIVLRAYAEDSLYPALLQWPVPTETGEVVLAQRDGDDMLVLNDVRFAEDAALSLRIPLERQDVSVVRAARGETGIVEAVDYRGEPVLAYLVGIEDSPWVMSVEVDRSEAFSALIVRLRLIAGMTLALVVLVGLGLVLVRHQLRAEHLASRLAVEQAEREAQKRLVATMRSIGDAVISTDADARVEFMNPIAEELTGWPLDEARGRPLGQVFVIINEATRLPVSSPVETVLRDNVVVGLANHTALIARDGSERPIADSAAPIHDDAGAITGVVLVFRDQTDERAASDALAASEARFRSLVEGAPDAIFVQTTGRFSYVNDAMCRLLAASSAEELLGREILERVHPDSREAARGRMRAINEDHATQAATDVAFVRLDGSTVHAETAGVPITLDGVDGALVFVRDITERIAAQRALRESEERFRALVTASSDVIYRMSPDWRTMQQLQSGGFLSETAEPNTEWLAEYIPPDERPRVQAAISAAIEMGSVYDLEHRVARADGTIGWTHSRAIPILDSDGEVVEWFGTASDVTDHKLAEIELDRHRNHLEELVEERTRELARANAELAEATAAKSAFLASMSHELRTPLNSIIGFSGLLGQGLAGPLTEEQETQIGMISRSGRHLLSLIDDVLDLSKVEAGGVEVITEPFDAREVLAEVTAQLAPLMAEKGLALESVLPATPAEVTTDKGKVRQILLNLLGNAIKFTDAGGIEARLERKDGGALAFSIADTGPGIPAESLERIFEPFAQVDQHGSEAKPPGTGLGLSISREYARMLGGDVSVRSEWGGGATFTLTVPDQA